MWIKTETGETYNFFFMKKIFISFRSGAAQVVGQDINGYEVILSNRYANVGSAEKYKTKLEDMLKSCPRNSVE